MSRQRAPLLETGMSYRTCRGLLFNDTAVAAAEVVDGEAPGVTLASPADFVMVSANKSKRKGILGQADDDDSAMVQSTVN